MGKKTIAESVENRAKRWRRCARSASTTRRDSASRRRRRSVRCKCCIGSRGDGRPAVPDRRRRCRALFDRPRCQSWTSSEQGCICRTFARARRLRRSTGTRFGSASSNRSSIPRSRPKGMRSPGSKAIAWEAYQEGRKAPLTRRPERGSPIPTTSYRSNGARRATGCSRAEARQRDPATRSRVLVIVGAARNDGSCPGEISKTFRLAKFAREMLEQPRTRNRSARPEPAHVRIRPADLSLQGLRVDGDAAVPLAVQLLSQSRARPDRRLDGEIYERWAAAHGVIIVTPVYWYQAPSALKLMIDRLVCADGGNPDPTATRARIPHKAKALELAGWPYPQAPRRTRLRRRRARRRRRRRRRCGARCPIGSTGWD